MAERSFRDYTPAFLRQKAWGMQVKCASCGRVRTLFAEDLAKLPQEATFAQIAPKLRCTACEKADGLITVVNDREERTRRDLERFEADVAAGRKPGLK